MEEDSVTLSQSSQMDEDALNDLDNAAQPENTVKATKWAMSRLRDWLKKRHVPIDVKTVTAEELAPLLRRFYGELKTFGGKPLTPSSLVGIRAGIQRGLTLERADPLDILHGQEFAKANSTFTAKCKLYARQGHAKPQRKEDIAEGDLTKIKEYLGSENTALDPRKLQQAVWFAIAFNTGCRGREMYRQLRKDCLVFAEDDQGEAYFTIEQSVVEKNHNGGPYPEQQWTNSTRIYDCELGKHRLVDIMKLYCSKLNQNYPWLFQQCRFKVSPTDETWYKNEPLGVNTLGQMMKTISQSAGLSKVYTNHCVRATTITVLLNAGVDTNHIRARTGHRTVEGLQPYIGHQTAQQKRTEASILGSALHGEGASNSAAHVNINLDTSQQAVQAQTGGMSAGGVVQGHFANCTFAIQIHHHSHQ